MEMMVRTYQKIAGKELNRLLDWARVSRVLHKVGANWLAYSAWEESVDMWGRTVVVVEC